MDMENGADKAIMDHQQLQRQEEAPPRRKKGGLITMLFIIANEALEKVASYGLSANMILYVMGDYHIGVTQATNILFLWSAATNFLPLVGAFISDSYLGRYLTIGLGCIASLLGIVVLWLTAMIPQARPPHCNLYKESCKSPSSAQYAILLGSFALMSIGAGGIRPCSIAFGADQVDNRAGRQNENNRVLEKFFSWYYAATAVAVLVAFTVIVYLQDHTGWKIGFGIPAILMFLSAVSFFLASPFYIKQKATSSLFTSLVQVMVVSFKNRKVALPSQTSISRYHNKDSTLSEPTNKLRFLNKACIIRNPEDLTPDGAASNPWKLCTVEQVEELKSLVRVMPLWSSAIMMSINVSQGSFQLLQAKSMDRHVTSSFSIPAGSFGMFTIAGAVLWIVTYDRVILPLSSKIRGKPARVGLKTRMGLGLFCSFLAMAVAATVEHFRKRKAIESGFLNNPLGVIPMSAMFLVPQHLLNGMAEAFNAVAQNEFFYSELPKKMSSIAICMAGLGLAVGSLLASVVINTVDKLTRRGGKESWLTNNINKAHYESYYWLLAIMSAINIFYFLLCSWAYGPCSNEGFFTHRHEGKDVDEEEMSKIGNGDNKEEEEMSKIENGDNKEEEEMSKIENGDNKELEEKSKIGNGGNKNEGKESKGEEV
ncbi:Protein NRT1/ PTR FAMILY 1.2 [Camellia lanceoleosa]|uniref:Protein NRT1/ PTR FAMILY 1.2 n=1 Tax=Camellia lanceoleosa TaxID=1840588 RepID=A0ACC0FDD9_9ERIC|nr:Protein NRT1/ PTR FAMILY 1.2 [Camellia lanceoleosa]